MSPESPVIASKQSDHCDPTSKKFAFGIAPMGVVAIGIVPMGVVCIGVVPMGLVGIGLVSMGAFTASVVGMWLLSIGFNTMAVWTAGPLSMGFVNLSGSKQQIPHVHHSHPSPLIKNSQLESQLMYSDKTACTIPFSSVSSIFSTYSTSLSKTSHNTFLSLIIMFKYLKIILNDQLQATVH